jgi:hypothetical protein
MASSASQRFNRAIIGSTKFMAVQPTAVTALLYAGGIITAIELSPNKVDDFIIAGIVNAPGAQQANMLSLVMKSALDMGRKVYIGVACSTYGSESADQTRFVREYTGGTSWDVRDIAT